MADKKGSSIHSMMLPTVLLLSGLELWAAPVSLQTKLYSLRHVQSEQALGYLTKISPGSDFSAAEVKAQNGLLLRGSEAEIQIAEGLLALIDVPALQVTLSCVIVEFKGAEPPELNLSTLEKNKSVEVLARPKLTTVNGNKAELNVINTAYHLVRDVSPDGFPITDYRAFNEGVSLEITPTVTQDGSVILDVLPEIKTAGSDSGDGPHDMCTRNLKTVVVLKDGETFCLGGLIRKNKASLDDVSELAIFITPRVKR